MQLADLQSEKAEHDVHTMALTFGLREDDHSIVKRSNDQSGDDRLSVAFTMLTDPNEFLTKVRRDRLVIIDEQSNRTIQRHLNQIFDLVRERKASCGTGALFDLPDRSWWPRRASFVVYENSW